MVVQRGDPDFGRFAIVDRFFVQVRGAAVIPLIESAGCQTERGAADELAGLDLAEQHLVGGQRGRFLSHLGIAVR